MQSHPEYEYMTLPHYFSANSAPWCTHLPRSDNAWAVDFAVLVNDLCTVAACVTHRS